MEKKLLLLILIALVVLLFQSCVVPEAVQVGRYELELVRIEPFDKKGEEMKRLTWRDHRGADYEEEVPASISYIVGQRTTVLLKK